jgi:hypothetical protein
MSQADNRKPPEIRPELLKRWKQFRAKLASQFHDTHKTYKFHGENLPFQRMHSWVRFQKTDPPTLDWNTESNDGDRVETARWTVGLFTLVARQRYSTEMAELDGIGHFCSKESPDSGKLNAVWERKTTRNRYPRGSDNRHGWMTGFYDRTHGGNTSVGHNKHSQIVLEDYDYADERNGWWLQGYTKLEADLLARKQYASRIEYLEGIDDESNVYVELKVYLADDVDEEDALSENCSADILSGTETDYTELALEMVDRAVEEAQDTIRRRVSRYQPELPGIEP